MTERKTKKVKKEGDTCRDCWTPRFRKELLKQHEEESKKTKAKNPLPLAKFLNRELQTRQDIIETMREEFHDLYDEISAIEHLAGDIYMGRFDKEEDD